MNQGSASAAWRAAGDAARQKDEVPAEAAPSWKPEEWIDEGAVREEASDAVGRGRRAGERRSRGWTPAVEEDEEVAAAVAEREAVDGRDVDAELRKAVGASRVAKAAQRLRDGGDAFRRSRYDEARRLLRPLAETAPQVPAVRELYGLTLYRLGRWKAAAAELEAFRTLTGSVEQHPVLADCYRALRRRAAVEELWNELKAASPNAALVAEGRIVAAGALADAGRVEDAIELLKPGVKPVRKVKEHHLRMAYALADLYERAGDLPQAREMFQRVAASDPEFVDVESRLQALQ